MASLGYTITKVGLTLAGPYPAGSLYFIVQFANGVVNDFVFPDLLASLAQPAWSSTTDYEVGQLCVMHNVQYVCVGTNGEIQINSFPVPVCVNESPPNTTYWAVQLSNVYSQIPAFLFRVMTNLVAHQAQGVAAISGADPHITVNPNVGGVPAAAMALNGTSGTVSW